MKKVLSAFLALVMVFGLCACGAAKAPVDDGKLVIWHDKEDAVIEALSSRLKETVPDLDIVFEKDYITFFKFE